MKPGDLVRIVSENRTHGGKIALIVGTDLNSWHDAEIGRDRVETVFRILLEGKIKSGVGGKWLEAIDETR